MKLLGVLSLLCVLLNHHIIDAGPLLVTNTEGNVRSRVGCRLTLNCSGIGTGIEWRTFGILGALGNNTSINRWITTQNNVDEWRSNLVFHPLQMDHQGGYTCTVRRAGTGTTTTTVLLTVAEKPVEIFPRIETFNISRYRIGDMATVGCPIQTCALRANVTFLRGDNEIGAAVLSGSQMTHNLNVMVDENTAGQYACKVDIDGFSVIQCFNMTGTPLPALPTSIPPPPPTDSDGSPLPTSPTSPTDSTDPDSTLTTTAQVPLLVILLAISTALGQFL